MAWNPDPEPFSKKEILTTLAIIAGCVLGCYLLKDINLYVALFIGAGAFYGLWLLFCDLLCIYKNVQYSAHTKTKERHRMKIENTIIPIICIVIPTICLVIGIILAIITVNNR